MPDHPEGLEEVVEALARSNYEKGHSEFGGLVKSFEEVREGLEETARSRLEEVAPALDAIRNQRNQRIREALLGKRFRLPSVTPDPSGPLVAWEDIEAALDALENSHA